MAWFKLCEEVDDSDAAADCFFIYGECVSGGSGSGRSGDFGIKGIGITSAGLVEPLGGGSGYGFIRIC